MMSAPHQRILLGGLTALLIALVPASAGAASHGASILIAGPVKARAYQLYLVAIPATQTSAAELLVLFRRGNSHHSQEHYYGFAHGVAVKIARGGHSASVRGDLGRYGDVALTFTSGGRRLSLPAGCHGVTVGQRYGHLSGAGLALDSHSSYFGTITRRSLPAYIATVLGGLSCKPSLPAQSRRGPKGTQLTTVVAQPGPDEIIFTASRTAHGFIAEDVLVLASPSGLPGPTILHSIDESGLPASDFTFAANLSSAHASGAAPFLVGRLTFTETAPTSSGLVAGRVQGDLTAHFDGLGTFNPTAGALEATLGH